MASNQDMQMLADSYEKAVRVAEDADKVGDDVSRDEAISIANRLRADIDSSQAGYQGQVFSSETQSTGRSLPENVSTVTGMTPSQSAERGRAGGQALAEGVTEAAITTARYAPAIAAGYAFGPAGFRTGSTIGNALRSMAVVSAKTAAAGAAGETSAQLAEIATGSRDKFNSNNIASETILSAFPQLHFGGKYTRSLVNGALSIGALEAAEAVKKGEYEFPKDNRGILLRLGLPVALSTAASVVSASAERAAGAAEKVNDLTNKRFGGGVALSDILPETTSLERKMIDFGNEIANSELRDVGANIGAVIDMAYKDIPSTSPVSAYISERKHLISDLKDKANQAGANARAAQDRYQLEKNNNGPKIAEALADSQKSALEAAKSDILYNQGIDLLFPSKKRITGIELSVAQGQRQQDLMSITGTAKADVKNQISSLYDAAGVGANDPVISIQGARAALSSSQFRGPGGLLEDNELYSRALKLVKDRFAESSSVLKKNHTTAPGQMTRGQFQRLRDDIADDLVASGKPRDAAARFASGVYQALQGTSDNFVRNNLMARNGRALGTQKFDAYLFARKASASDFNARSAGAIDAMASGDIKGLYASIFEQGAGPALSEVDAYARVIAGSGNPSNQASVDTAIKAADSFKNNFFAVIGDSVIDANLYRGTGQSGSRIINVGGMAKDLDTLASRGFPVERLGIGSRSQLSALARLGGAGKAAGYTTDELAKFFKDAETVGADKAALLVNYNNAVRNDMLDGMANVRGRINNQNKLRKLAKDYAITEQEAEQALRAASNDPLAVLMDQVRSGKAPNISMANGNDLVSSLLRTNHDTVSALMAALPQSLAEDLRKAAAAQVMRQFEPVLKSGTPNKIDIKALVQFFEGNDANALMGRASFRAIMGNDRYDAIFNRMYGAVKSSSDTINRLASNVGEGIGATALGSGRFKARAGNAALYTNPSTYVSLAKSQRYNLLYYLYVNPESAPKFRAFSGNLASFAKSSPLIRHAVDLANQKDNAESGFTGFKVDPSSAGGNGASGDITELMKRLGAR